MSASVKYLLLFLFLIGIASAQPGPPPGGSVIGCVGTPGNTVGSYRQLCQDSGGTIYACNNQFSCTVAGDWVSQKGSGTFVYPTGTGFTIVTAGTSWGTTLADPLGAGHGGTGSNITPGAAGHYLRSNGTVYVDAAIQAADVPTLNQNTSGNAATATNLASYPSTCTAGNVSLGLSSGSNNCSAPFTLTTTGSSGAATFSGGTLNIPQYTGGGSSAFNAITSGTNTTAAMIVSSGSSLTPTGLGVISANQVNGGTIPTSQPCVGTDINGKVITGTCTTAYAYNAYSGSAALALGTYNSVQVTASGGNPTITVSTNPATQGAFVWFNFCNDNNALGRTWTLPANFKLIGAPNPGAANECIATVATWDGTNYNGPGTNATPSLLEFTATRPAISAANCPPGGCAWIDSTDNDFEFGNSSSLTFAAFLKGVDANPVTGQVTTLPHVTDGSLANSGLAHASITVNGITCTLGSTCGPYGGVNVYTSSHTVNGAGTVNTTDTGKLIVMNCGSACALTFESAPAATDWWGVESIGSTVATVSLNSKNFNGTSSVPVLNSFRDMLVSSDGTNYFGPAPLVAGTNMTLTPASNGLTLTASSSASTAFSALTSSTNTTAAMVVGSGASLATTGTGSVSATKIVDSNQNSAVTVSTTASAVDNIQVTNAATANPATVTITAVGTDSNVNLNLVSKGTGTVQCNGSTCGSVPTGTAGQQLAYPTAGAPSAVQIITDLGSVYLPNPTPLTLTMTNGGVGGDFNFKSGGSDYTVPSNRIAVCTGITVNGTSSGANVIPELKISGTYYGFQSVATPTTNTQFNFTIVLSTGYLMGLNVSSTANTINGWANCIEADNTANIATGYALSPTSGTDATVINCNPGSGHGCIPVNTSTSGVLGTAAVTNFSSASNSTAFTWKIGPSGSTVIFSNRSTTGSSNSIQVLGINYNMANGDIMTCNPNATTANQMCYATYIKF